jgi:hypothetical protein
LGLPQNLWAENPAMARFATPACGGLMAIGRGLL